MFKMQEYGTFIFYNYETFYLTISIEIIIWIKKCEHSVVYLTFSFEQWDIVSSCSVEANGKLSVAGFFMLGHCQDLQWRATEAENRTGRAGL